LLTGTSQGGAEKKSNNIGMVPLGTPLLAGPGAIVATMIYVQKADTSGHFLGLALAIVAVHLIIGTVLMASSKIVHIIKEAGVSLPCQHRWFTACRYCCSNAGKCHQSLYCSVAILLVRTLSRFFAGDCVFEATFSVRSF
jgi:hypothetical protein